MSADARERPPVKQAVILAGGQGQRLRPLTEDRPKCMVEVAGAPIILWQLRWLEANKCPTWWCSLGYKADALARLLSRPPTSISISLAFWTEPLGRGGGLKSHVAIPSSS